jgi:hypothetical protein
MKKIILSLSVLTLCVFAQNSLPVTEVPVSDSAPSANPTAVQQEAAQAAGPESKPLERSPASTKKKHHTKKIVKKKVKKKKKAK